MTRPPVPKGLGAPGRALWRRIVGVYELREDEISVLEHAARTTDYVARLDAALVDAPLTVPGSAGQLREHPLMSEVRQQRALLARLLHQLRLPDTDELAALRSGHRSTHARSAAQARWTHRGA